MRSPLTAKDDQPGPTGRRHICTGGLPDQSVSIFTPRTMPSRFGPRKPGHAARVSTGCVVGVLGVSEATEAVGEAAGIAVAGASEAVGAGAAGAAVSFDWANSRSSGLAAQRQPNVAW